VLRRSFASVANDLGYTEITIAALIGHSKGTMTSKYVHTLDSPWSQPLTPSLVTSTVCSMEKNIGARHTRLTMSLEKRR
jgi:hypothetical protein